MGVTDRVKMWSWLQLHLNQSGLLHRALFVVYLASVAFVLVLFVSFGSIIVALILPSRSTPLSTLLYSPVVVIPQSNYDFSRPLLDFLDFIPVVPFQFSSRVLAVLGSLVA